MLFLVRLTVFLLVLYLDGMASLVSSSIRQDRLDIFLPVLRVLTGHSLYITDCLDSEPINGLDVLKRTVWRGKGNRLFLDRYSLFLVQYAVLFLEGVSLFLVLFLVQCVSLYIVVLLLDVFSYI